MTRRRRFAIKWSILTSVSTGRFSALAKSKTIPTGSIDLLYRNSWNGTYFLRNGEQAMIEAARKRFWGKCAGCRAAEIAWRCSAYSQHLRGLIARYGWSRKYRATSFRKHRQEPVASRRCGFRADVGTGFERRCLGAEAGGTLSNSTARFRYGTSCTGCRYRWKPTGWKLPSVVDEAAPAKGLSSSSLKKRAMRKALMFIFWIVTGRKCITTAKVARKNWCATSVASIHHRTIASRMAPVYQL